MYITIEDAVETVHLPGHDGWGASAGSGSGCGVGVALEPRSGSWLVVAAESSSPKMSKYPATRALFVPFFITCSRNSALRLGCFSTTSRSCSLGSCRSAPNDCGAMSFAQRMKPSQSGGFVQIFFVISRESSVVETKPRSERYVVTAWMTYATTCQRAVLIFQHAGLQMRDTLVTYCAEEESG